MMEVWRPSLMHARPAGLPMMPYAIWALFWLFRIFRDPGYSIYLIRDAATGKVIHRSHIFPRWLRFPFMKPGDLQIGDTFTDPDYRGNKLAEIALTKIASDLSQEGRTLWYVVREDNASSIRVAEKSGFKVIGKGDRYKRFGSGLLGVFRIDSE